MPHPLALLIDCHARGEACALVTLVGIAGAAPRRIGAQMAISAGGAVAGSFSGGCLDGAVIEEAQRALADGASRRVRYGDDSPYIDIVLPCGSGLDLQFDGAIPAPTLAAIAQTLQRREPLRLSWAAPSQPPACTSMRAPISGSDAHAPRDTAASVSVCVQPPLRLILAGAGETLWTMCKLARAAEIDTLALSPDRELRAPLDALGVRLHTLHAQHAFPTLSCDGYTAAIALFHDHDWELPFLRVALAGDACLVGAMGSARAHALRLERLREAGVSEPALARLRGPLGLLPRARDPQELAVSILAEAMLAYRTRCFPDESAA